MAAGTGGELSRRTFVTASAAGAALLLLAPGALAAPVRRTTGLTVQACRLGAVFVGEPATFTITAAAADTVRWTARDVWGAATASGQLRLRNGQATLSVRTGQNGYFALELTAWHGATQVADARTSFAVLAPYRLPADSPFGANTHLQPPSMVPLMAALGITWARTDLTWADIEPPPLAGWSSEVYQADATVALDQTVAHTGHASVKIVNRSPIQDNYFATIAQEIAVQPATTYTFSAWVKGNNVKALQFTLAADWGSRVDAPSGTFDWTRVTFQHTTTTETSLTFRLLSSDVADAAWMDDASVTAAGSTTNLLANPGFENGLASGYTFDTFTPYLDALKAGGIHPLPILDYANPKYDNGLTPYTDAGRAAFAAYTTAVMRHYQHRFTAVEVYNEYNAGWFTTGPASADPAYYAQLLAVTHDAIKAVDKNVTVVGGVTYGTATDWLAKVFDAGGMAHLDAVSNHPYTGAPESATPVDMGERQVTALIEQYNGGKPKPVWISELGWSLADELTTAGYLVRGLVLGLVGGVAKFFWYDLVGDQNYGLLNQDGDAYSPRPVFSAYANAIRLLTGTTPAGGGQLGSSGVRSYVFHGGNDVAVLWSTDARDTVAVRTSRPITLVDVTGSATTLTPFDGNVHLTLTGTPLYLTGQAGVVTLSGRVDVTAPPLVRTSDGTVTFTYVIDNTAGTKPTSLAFSTGGVSTTVRANAGQKAQATATVPVTALGLGKNTVVTLVNDGRNVVGRLVSPVVVVDVPAVVVATVGTVDWTDHEFALAPGGYGDFAGTFPNDVTFTAGVDDPAKAWPYIHPGPDDGWAGGRPHPFTLAFTLAAAADLQLVVFLLDTHNTAPGTVDIAVNGGPATTITLPAGSGTGYSAGSAFDSADKPTQFSVPLPASRLAAGRNVVTITKSAGSWMVYDAVGVYRS